MFFLVASFMLLYLNEYHVAQAVYTLHGDSKLWLDNITKAQVWSSVSRIFFLSHESRIRIDNNS